MWICQKCEHNIYVFIAQLILIHFPISSSEKMKTGPALNSLFTYSKSTFILSSMMSYVSAYSLPLICTVVMFISGLVVVLWKLYFRGVYFPFPTPPPWWKGVGSGDTGSIFKRNISSLHYSYWSDGGDLGKSPHRWITAMKLFFTGKL